VDAKGIRVDLVDRHMHVFVVFVVVARGNVLVLSVVRTNALSGLPPRRHNI
jgi:hypothetical protein